MPGTVVEQTSEPRARLRRHADDGPLTAEQSERLASLYKEYGARLVGYVYSRLRTRSRTSSVSWALAEDITQTLWLRLAREGSRCLLLSNEEPVENMAGLLFYRAKQEINQHFQVSSSGEIAVDFGDPVTCNRLCLMMPSGCALVEMPAYLTEMVDALPEQERAALLLMLDGLDPRSMAERLGCADSTAVRLANSAVLMLQIDNPELSREPVALESLPKWEREALSSLSPERCAALLRLEPTTRQALVLKHQGVSKGEIAKRLGLSYDATAAVVRCVPSTSHASKRRSPAKRANSKFAQAADALRQDIKAMRPGDRLPRRTELMKRFGVGSRTIDRAWAVLCGEGLIESNGAYGYTVARAQGDMGRAA